MLRSFSWKPGINHFTTQSVASSSALSLLHQESDPDLPKSPAYYLERGPPTPRQPSLLRPSIAAIQSTGILTRFPSTTRLRLALGAD